MVAWWKLNCHGSGHDFLVLFPCCSAFFHCPSLHLISSPPYCQLAHEPLHKCLGLLVNHCQIVQSASWSNPGCSDFLNNASVESLVLFWMCFYFAPVNSANALRIHPLPSLHPASYLFGGITFDPPPGSRPPNLPPPFPLTTHRLNPQLSRTEITLTINSVNHFLFLVYFWVLILTCLIVTLTPLEGRRKGKDKTNKS